MPLTAQLSRNAHLGPYAGLTEPITMRRRNPDGTMDDAVQEAWIAYPVPAVESSDQTGVQITNVHRDWLAFNVGCDGVFFGPPRIGDQIGRNRDGSWWDISPESTITYMDTSNYGFRIQSTKRVIPPVNG